MNKTLILAVLLMPLLWACDNDKQDPPLITLPKIKSVETTGSIWSSREEFAYNEKGQLASIQWKRQTPHETTGSETYYYDDTNQLSRIIKKTTGLAEEEVRYTYQQSQIIATSSYVNGLKIAYQLYSYDTEDRLEVIEFYSYNSEANGYDRNGEHRYAYYTDGNVKDIQYFDFHTESATLVWNSTKVYTSYLDAPNPLSLDSTVPGIVIQRNLPGGLELRYPSSTAPYTFTYEFREDGYPSKRRSTYGDGSSEVSVFTYE